MKVRLTEDMIAALEKATGKTIKELEGIVVEVADDNSVVLTPVFDDEGQPEGKVLRAAGECSCVEGNLWQGQKGCANFLTKC